MGGIYWEGARGKFLGWWNEFLNLELHVPDKIAHLRSVPFTVYTFTGDKKKNTLEKTDMVGGS